MKKLLSAFILFTITATSFAQQNPGFETWDSLYSSKEEPQKWITLNLFCSPLVDANNPRSVYKVLPPNQAQGALAMRIKTIKMSTNPTQGLLNDTCGIAMTGTVTISPGLALIDRIPYTARPSNFHFMFQSKPVGTPIDTCLAYIELTKWNTSLSRRDTVATGGWWSYTTVNAWTHMSLPLYYWPNHINMYPDSVSIVFSSSARRPKLGSELWVDDCYFQGWTGVQDINGASSHVSTYPNPAKDNITISADLENAYSVTVYDGIGQVIGKYDLTDKKYMLNTSALRPGNYYFSVMDKSGAVISGNTFTVVK